MQTRKNIMLGTAGHVDHGKTAVVRMLTGCDTDTLAEEKARGLTIDLGFAWLTLPSGREVSIVDVPGHERFIKNMLAGVSGMDLALLVVAANEAIKPQTREHLAILDLMEVPHLIAVITQVAIGITVLLLGVPVLVGVAHQAGALFVLTALTLALRESTRQAQTA